ncbi:MAG: hypothetical protein KGM17_06395 [Sphingomonadales bacterium]|nr:hypothetical protein [Sphingomonadales bacterium]
MSRRLLVPFLSLAAALPLSACDGGGGGVVSAPPPPRSRPQRYVPPPVIHRAPAPSAHVQSLPGLEGVIGVGEGELARQFGTPRLTVWEGDARKLQFSGPPCVLDVYLYPPSPGAEPRATYVDARRATDGRDVDRAACVAALKAAARRAP